MLRSSLLALAAAIVILPASAAAQTVNPTQINGNPLTVSTDQNGRLGAAYTGSQSAEFYGSFFNTDTGVLSTGNAGFSVTVLGTDSGSYQVYGQGGNPGTVTSGPTLSGSGTAASPFTIATVWSFTDSSGGPLMNIQQILSYVNGQTTFNAHLDVANTSGAPLLFRSSMFADLTGGGSDSGLGFFDPGPPRFIAGLNPNSGSLTGLQEATTWTHYQEGQLSDVRSNASGDPRTPTNLSDAISSETVDNAVAAQWDNYASGGGLPAGATGSFDVAWRFERTFDLEPGSAFATPGVPTPLTASVSNANGSPHSGVKIVFTSGSGANQTITTDGSGNAVYNYVPVSSGSDTITAFADLNGNGTQDPGEPSRQSLVVTTGQVNAPIQGQTATAAPVAGTVKVKFPKGFTPAGKQSAFAHSAASKFTVLKNAQTIPIGSQIDVSRGSIQLASSTSGVANASTIQTGTFSLCQPSKHKKTCKARSTDSSSFTMTQSATGDGTNEMVMTGAMSCPSGKGKAVAAARKKKTRSLWGSDNGGKFRTRGRHSSATVRGTEWFQKDTCSGTTTKVTRGSVTVKDFTKKKNVVVKAGHSYTAKAKKRRK